MLDSSMLTSSAALPSHFHVNICDAAQAFDDLLLMKSGGMITYHGHLGKRSHSLVEYFEVNTHCHYVCRPVVPVTAYSLLSAPTHQNPITTLHSCWQRLPPAIDSAVVFGSVN